MLDLHHLTGREEAVQCEDVAHLRVAGVRAVSAGRVCHHLHHPLLDFLR